MNITIYIVKNKIDDKVYIGQTTCVKQRWNDHKCNALTRKKKSKFYDAIRKYGVENFYYKILEEDVLPEQAELKETEYIKLYNSVENGFNTKYRTTNITKLKDFNALELVKLYEDGCTLEHIATMYNSDKKIISSILKKNGVRIRDWNKLQSNPKITKEFLVEEIVKKRKKISTVADEVNLSDTAIRNWLRKFEIKMPLSTVK